MKHILEDSAVSNEFIPQHIQDDLNQQKLDAKNHPDELTAADVLDIKLEKVILFINFKLIK